MKNNKTTKTYGELLTLLKTLDEPQLRMNLSLKILGEFISGADREIQLAVSTDSTDVLDNGHPYILITKRED